MAALAAEFPSLVNAADIFNGYVIASDGATMEIQSSLILMFILQHAALSCRTRYTCMHWAAKKGNVHMLEALTLSQTNWNMQSHGGYTPLYLAG